MCVGGGGRGGQRLCVSLSSAAAPPPCPPHSLRAGQCTSILTPVPLECSDGITSSPQKVLRVVWVQGEGFGSATWCAQAAPPATHSLVDLDHAWLAVQQDVRIELAVKVGHLGAVHGRALLCVLCMLEAATDDFDHHRTAKAGAGAPPHLGHRPSVQRVDPAQQAGGQKGGRGVGVGRRARRAAALETWCTAHLQNPPLPRYLAALMASWTVSIGTMAKCSYVGRRSGARCGGGQAAAAGGRRRLGLAPLDPRLISPQSLGGAAPRPARLGGLVFAPSPSGPPPPAPRCPLPGPYLPPNSPATQVGTLTPSNGDAEGLAERVWGRERARAHAVASSLKLPAPPFTHPHPRSCTTRKPQCAAPRWPAPRAPCTLPCSPLLPQPAAAAARPGGHHQQQQQGHWLATGGQVGGEGSASGRTCWGARSAASPRRSACPLQAGGQERHHGRRGAATARAAAT